MIYLTSSLPKKEPTCAAEIRIYSLFNAYGNSNIALFWQQQNDEGITTALISKMDGAVTLWAKENADTDEIVRFIGVVGAQSVLSNLPLNMNDERVVYQFCYAPTNTADIELIPPDYKSIYGIMSTRFDMPSYDVWYPDMCHRERHGATYLVGEGDAALCGLSAANSMLIVGLCSTPSSKGQGRGSKLLSKIINSNLAKRYTVLAEEELKQYYVNQGFTLLGNHYTYGDV